MKNRFLSILTLLFIFLLSCQKGNNAPSVAPKDGVFVHISHGTDDPHRVLMGLQMAVIMSEERDVILYFDITGVNVVLKDAEALQYAQFPDSKTQLQKLLAKGIKIMACPGCLKAAGKSEEDLMAGVQVADKDAFFNFTKGRILTIDY